MGYNVYDIGTVSDYCKLDNQFGVNTETLINESLKRHKT